MSFAIHVVPSCRDPNKGGKMAISRSVRWAFALIFSFTVSAVAGFGFSLQDALERIDETLTVRTAQVALDGAEAALRKISYAGNFSLTAAPQAKLTTEFMQPFPEQTVVSGTVTGKVPVGLSEAQKLQLSQAEAAVRTARERLSQAREAAHESIYGLYMQAWLAQEEQKVFAEELAAARAYTAALQEQFRAGKVSFIDLTTADEDLRNRESAAAKGGLDRRLSWLKLMTAIALPYSPDTPTLEPDPALFNHLDLPKPPELATWALKRDADLQTLTTEVVGTEQLIALLGQPDVSTSVQLLGGVSDHGFSLSYTFDQPQIGASYTIPFYTNGTIPGSNSSNLTDTWNVGIGFSLSFSGGKGNTLEIDALKAQLDQGNLRLEERRSALQLDVRSRYQEWITSTENITLTEGVVKRAEANGKIVDSRRSLGLASDYELLQSQAFIARARYTLEAARSEARQRFLAAANSAGYLSKVIDSFQNGGKQ